MMIYVKEDNRTFLIRLNTEVLQKVETFTFDFTKLDYRDITKLLKNQRS